MDQIKAMRLALEALEVSRPIDQRSVVPQNKHVAAITSLKAAIQEAALQNITDFDVQSTHSADCYKWHHACAVARIERAEKQEPVAWMESPYGAIRANPLYKVSAPQSISWSIPLYTDQPPYKAEQAQPVAWIDKENNCAYTAAELDGEAIEGLVPLYTAPPQRQPLSDEEIDRVTDAQWASNNHKPIYAAHRAYARAIEAKLKEKNT